MIKRTARKQSIDELVRRAMSGRLVAIGAIGLAKELGVPWQSIARSLQRLAQAGVIVEEEVRVRVDYRYGGFFTRRYKIAEPLYPEWLEIRRQA